MKNKTQICRLCNQEKPLDCFHRSKVNPSGYRYQCKECRKAENKDPARKTYKAQWYQNNKELTKRRSKQHYRENRDTHLQQAKSRYLANKESIQAYKQAWAQENKVRLKIKRRTYYQTNRSRFLAYGREYHCKNPHVALNARLRRRAYQDQYPELSGQDWQRIMQSNQWCCIYCGKYLGGTINTERTIDHLIPVKRGGSHTVDNLAPSYRSCNSKKHTKTYEEFIDENT